MWTTISVYVFDNDQDRAFHVFGAGEGRFKMCWSFIRIMKLDKFSIYYLV